MVDKEIKEIQQIRDNKIFVNYIEYIRYPFFKNLIPGTKISFDFPITFLVGKNGSGKSSVLQSLYGCPKGYSLGDYWFSTKLDPIDESKNRNAIIYAYEENDTIFEVLKQRILRQKNFDNWEPSRPVKKYGMDTSQRNSPIDKEVIYLDFRAELSAFDCFMYSIPFTPTPTILTRQDYIRAKSGKLKEAYDSGKIIKYYGKNKNEPAIKLSEQEVKIISHILGKKYEEITILDHSFYKNKGFSIRLKSPELNYSEAYAGSGETAVIILVHRIHKCNQNTLLLLDEPETSLHPGSQKRLRDYLLTEIKKKKLQIVVSTHSPFLLDEMPKNSIKVFKTNAQGKFQVEDERRPQEAFLELEFENNDKVKIIVEDDLAKEIIYSVLKDMGEDIAKSFDIQIHPGGAQTIKKNISQSIDFNLSPYIIFDGDQKPSQDHINPLGLTQVQYSDPDFLDEKIKEQTGCKISFAIDGAPEGGGNINQKLQKQREFLQYYLDKVHYLPESIPEDIIWNDEIAIEKIIFIKGLDREEAQQKLEELKGRNSKEHLHNLSNYLYDLNEGLKFLQAEFIQKWIHAKDESYTTIKNLLDKMRDQ
ncbi:AAA family ATPase [Robertkochia flava]|uniref:AAA family ATPase n=1 Tax=Robertkochia flava TaxID=3447986 RepID=UPI001CC9DAE5|nr:AAA family ATPase [Robertkochia marina]